MHLYGKGRFFSIKMGDVLKNHSPTSDNNLIINDDCLNAMKGMKDNSISCVVTDPPYGIAFMGKEWDSRLPSIHIWKEALRIVKPGGYLLCFGGTRTYHKLCCHIEDAGWQIRDCLMWIFGSGFPKSHNHFGLDGYGTALKPAYEPIIMAMKPLDGTFKQNAEKWGQAGINIDECRIGTDGATKRSEQSEYPKNENGTEDRSQYWARTGHSIQALSKGRWPANIIFDEEACEMLGPPSRFFYCPKASSRERNEGLDGLPYLNNMRVNGPRESEKEKTATKVRNNHPTVKPLKLMEYLVRLIMPPKDGILLDPFAGSGSTLVACRNIGVNYIGIEVNKEYVEICKSRLCKDKKNQQEEISI